MAFAFIVPITIDHTQCGAANSTDWPFLIRGTYAGAGGDPDLRVTGSGGDVTQSDGDDINIFSDSGATTKLKWQLVRYIPSTGEIVMWIKIPTLTFGSDTVIYMGYGDSSITTFQGDITGTWNSAFKAVYHFPDGTTLSLTDSTSNARNGTAQGTIVAATGVVEGCFSNVGSGDAGRMEASDTGLPSGTSDRTISIWWYSPTAAGFSSGYLWSLGNFATANQSMACSIPNGTYLRVYDGSLNDKTVTLNHDTWYHLVVTWTSTGGEMFVNGSSIGTWTNGSQNTTLIGTYYMGCTNPGVFNTPCLARLDEHRISNVVRSNSWIIADYNSQKPGATFYAFGTPTPPASAIAPIVHHLKEQGIM